MRCSVVFGVMLRLLVINISSSSLAINTAAYYQRSVITCETVAVHRRPRLQHLPVAALTQAVKPDIRWESRFLPTTPAIYAPVRGVPVGILIMPFGKEKLEGRGYPTMKKIWWYVYSFWHDPRSDRHTDRRTDTAWRHRPRLHSIARQKSVIATLTATYVNFTNIAWQFMEICTPVCSRTLNCFNEKLCCRTEAARCFVSV